MRLTLSDFPERIYNIKDYGAVCSDRLQTEAIQSALDACFLAGGGRVIVPAGIYLTGGLRLRSNTVMYLESGAQLRGSTNPEDYMAFLEDTLEPLSPFPEEQRSVYPYSRWNNALIRVIDAEKVAIVGEKALAWTAAIAMTRRGRRGTVALTASTFGTARTFCWRGILLSTAPTGPRRSLSPKTLPPGT